MRATRRCRECGAGAVKERVEDQPLDSLPDVIVRGLRVRRCGACGAEAVAVPRLAELHGLVVGALVRKAGRSTGAEVRYLRKWLGWSGRELAGRFGLTPEHVSRVENGHVPISGMADRLLRVVVAVRLGWSGGVEDVLEVGGDEGPLELDVVGRERRWRGVA